MPFTIVRQDITKMKVDAIVNAANTDLAMGGGVCGAIFRAAGAGKLQAACDKVAPISTGGAAITPGFALPAKYVIHAAGPVYLPWDAKKSEELLRSAYMESLTMAKKNGCESIAFPLISSGIYGYPKDEALRVATTAIGDFLAHNDMDVYLAVFGKAAFAASKELLGAVKSYIDENYVDENYVDVHRYSRRWLLDDEQESLYRNAFPPHQGVERALNAPNAAGFFDSQALAQEVADNCDAPNAAGFFGSLALAQAAADNCDAPNAAGFSGSPAPAKAAKPKRLAEMLGDLDEPFNEALFRLIAAKGMTDAQVYKRANIDRKLFSKIRTGKGYMPSKKTALALAIALELTLDETDDLLERAGYTLSHSQKFDVIIEYFIISGKYDIFEINEVLFQYDQPLLGAS